MTQQPSAAVPPVTGAWLPGDPAGRRQWVSTSTPLRLEAGGVLPGFELAYETWGQLNSDRSNAVLVEHALTGDSHAAGAAAPGHPSDGWWDGLIGPGRGLDTDEVCVVVPNVLGGCQGSTGPSSLAPDGAAWGGRFPTITVRDQVDAETLLADELGIQRWACVLGGSMGGMRAVEWGTSYPRRVDSLLLLACTAAASAEQIAWSSPQLHAITGDPGWRGGDYYDAAAGQGPHRGLAVARRIAQVTYRSEPELAQRFDRRYQDTEDPLHGGRFAMESYLDHHADKLVRRFDAGSYVALTESMNTHDVGRDRGGVSAALAAITARTLVAGVDSDRLYPAQQARRLAAGIPGAGEAAVLEAPYGHDSFLIETGQIAGLLKVLLG